MMNELKKTEINNNIVLEEYTDGLLFGTDALLLSRFVKGGSRMNGVDIGCGSGSISLLLLSENKALTMTGIEIQEKYSILSEKNANNNGFGERFKCINGDARQPKGLYEAEKADFVISNPPFMKANGGKMNDTKSKCIARHEEFLPANDLCKAAALYLKYGGSFYVVYRPERICTLITSLKQNNLEPKRIKFLISDINCAPSLVFIEAKKGGAEGVNISAITI